MHRFAIVVMVSSALGLLSCSSTSHSDLKPRPDTGHDTAEPTADATDDEVLPPAVDVFVDAPDFVALTPTGSSARVTKHVSHTGKTLTGTDCTPCHDGKTHDAPQLAFGGTVYYAPDAKTVAAGVEIRVVDADGVAHVVHSDQGGNFWLVGDPAKFPWPAHTGARTANDSLLMTADFDKVGCNQGMCHDGTDDYPYITIRKDPDEPPPP